LNPESSDYADSFAGGFIPFPPHIHVETPDGECKFWLHPIRLARNIGVSPKTVREIEKLVFQHQMMLVEKYNAYHS
jgi:hypothetical protein